MKTIIFPIIIFLLIFLNKNTCAKNFEVGIGFTLEHPYNAQFEFQESISLHKFYMPVTIDSSIRLIPELAYWDEESDFGDLEGYDDNKYSILQIGIGFYYLVYFDATKIYFGPRYAIINMKAPSK